MYSYIYIYVFYICCRHEYGYSDIRKLTRNVCFSMDVFCYPPYFFRSNKIEILRSIKSRSENMLPSHIYCNATCLNIHKCMTIFFCFCES